MLGCPLYKELGGMQMRVNSKWDNEWSLLVMMTDLPCTLTYCHGEWEAQLAGGQSCVAHSAVFAFLGGVLPGWTLSCTSKWSSPSSLLRAF